MKELNFQDKIESHYEIHLHANPLKPRQVEHHAFKKKKNILQNCFIENDLQISLIQESKSKAQSRSLYQLLKQTTKIFRQQTTVPSIMSLAFNKEHNKLAFSHGDNKVCLLKFDFSQPNYFASDKKVLLFGLGQKVTAIEWNRNTTYLAVVLNQKVIKVREAEE